MLVLNNVISQKCTHLFLPWRIVRMTIFFSNYLTLIFDLFMWKEITKLGKMNLSRTNLVPFQKFISWCRGKGDLPTWIQVSPKQPHNKNIYIFFLRIQKKPFNDRSEAELHLLTFVSLESILKSNAFKSFFYFLKLFLKFIKWMSLKNTFINPCRLLYFSLASRYTGSL